MDSSSVMWGGAMGGGGYGTMSLPGSRPITPGFPSTAPTTPYFNQSANNFNIVQQRINSCHSNASTTTTTATRNGRQSPLGGGGGGGGGLRSASPAFTANTLPSRRGSITSLATSGEPPTEVRHLAYTVPDGVNNLGFCDHFGFSDQKLRVFGRQIYK